MHLLLIGLRFVATCIVRQMGTSYLWENQIKKKNSKCDTLLFREAEEQPGYWALCLPLSVFLDSFSQMGLYLLWWKLRENQEITDSGLVIAALIC